MRTYLSVLTLGILGLWLGAASATADQASIGVDNNLVGRFHFVGTGRIGTDTNAAKLNEIAALPASKALFEQTLEKLSTAPARWLRQHLGSATNDYANLIRPLLDDLLLNESYAEMRGPTNAVPEVLLAVHLDKTRAAVWQANLSTVLSAWTGVKVTEIQPEGYKGWELKKHHDPNRIRLIRAGDWVLFGWGQDDILLQTGMLQRIKAKGRPVDQIKEGWLEAWVDFPKLAPYHPIPTPFKLPAMTLTVQGRGEFIRPQIVMQFPQPLGLVLEPWRIPTNTIHNPLISFTAVRGIGSMLDKMLKAKGLNVGQVPNQMAVWAMAPVPFETCFAMPVENGTNYLQTLEPGLVSLINSSLASGGIPMVGAEWTNNQIVIKGLPVLVPYLRVLHEPAGDFLQGGLFPSPNYDKPFPMEMLTQGMAPANLVYYDWEITEGRLQDWRPLNQLYLLASRTALPKIDSITQKWLLDIEPKLRNAATAVTLTGPSQLTMVRNSTIGLTGLELTALGYWLEAPGFPLDARHESVMPIVPPVISGKKAAQR
ncbi:MAG: hypothetical protein JWR26_2199 [Pedosphaera sp.]|nr:hypothetical protein [Pedosphaera sp.]